MWDPGRGRYGSTRHRLVVRPALSEPERELFARLGVFIGGWTLDAAEVARPISTRSASLVDKSLVRARSATRSAMLETIRDYATERLAESGAQQGDELAQAARQFFYEQVARVCELRVCARQAQASPGCSEIDLEQPQRAKCDRERRSTAVETSDGPSVILTSLLIGFWEARGSEGGPRTGWRRR